MVCLVKSYKNSFLFCYYFFCTKKAKNCDLEKLKNEIISKKLLQTFSIDKSSIY